jgi:hypothetical protein
MQLRLSFQHKEGVRHQLMLDRHDSSILQNSIFVQKTWRRFEQSISLLLLLLLSFRTANNTKAFAWISTHPTLAWNSYTTCIEHPPYHFQMVQNHPFLQYPPFYRRRCHKAPLSSIFSSSNSFISSSDVQIRNGFDRNNQDSNSTSYDSSNEILDVLTPTNEFFSESMLFENDTNDDNASFMDDSGSFWVTSSEHRGSHNAIEMSGNDDVPRPTENGGYSHTQASRAKISAANKGKVPWNKGVNRTDEVKARIAAGVRAKNRERHLQKLQEMGITEEEYEEQKRIERCAKEAERRARRTENGGYRPTDETKRKISEILKQKFASGEIKARPISPVHVRRGFTHSEETRQKISESLRKRWSTDSEYRAKMVDVSNRVNTKEEIRQKISESLRNKWQTDETFRNDMMSKIAARKRKVVNPETGTVDIVHHDMEHRAKISAAMKAKWQDKEYRERNLQSLASRRTAPKDVLDHGATGKSTKIMPMVPRSPKKASVVKSSKIVKEILPSQASETAVKQKVPLVKKSEPITNNRKKEISTAETSKNRPLKSKTNDAEEAVLLRPVQPLTAPHKKVKKAGMQGIVSEMSKSDDDTTGRPNRINAMDGGDKTESHVRMERTKRIVVQSEVPIIENDVDIVVQSEVVSSKKETKSTSSNASNGNVELLKAERRDLYDLLYGDDDSDDDGTQDNRSEDDDNMSSTAHIHDDYDESTLTGSTTPTLASIFARLEDDNLDTFDPYGLDDF